MNVMRINGGIPLEGAVRTQGAKNAALPVMAACLLLKGGTLALDNVPDLCDVSTMMKLLEAEELAYPGVSVVIPSRECVQTYARRQRAKKAEKKQGEE